MLACGAKSTADDDPTAMSKVGIESSISPNPISSEGSSIANPYNSSFTITSAICSDEQGPDCAALRLGDDYLTTSGPSKGYLYSCTDKNPNAPGSIENKITWIDFAKKTWDFFMKLWLPAGTFDPATGTYAETISGESREISVNNLPVDGKIGDWPMTNYDTLAGIDPNPGIPEPRDFSFSYPASPSEAPSPTCVSLGAIGVTKNGVILFNAADARGEDAPRTGLRALGARLQVRRLRARGAPAARGGHDGR